MADSVRTRCVVVGIGLTGAVWGAAAVLARTLSTETPRSVDAALVRVCLVALLLALAWAWLQGLAAIGEAWRGVVGSRRRGVVRRLVLAACGVAAVTALAASASEAASADHPGPGHPGPEVLAGLPMPERAVGPEHARSHQVVVRRGDTLWALAAADLGPRASTAEVAERWRLVYRRNRGVIGPDPDLIRPGQLLQLPHVTTKEPT